MADEVKKNPYAGTQTEKNLEAAFAGESQARNKVHILCVKGKEGRFRADRCTVFKDS